MPNLNALLFATFLALFGVVMEWTANAAIIEIVEQANGSFDIFSDGARHAGASTRAGAEKFAQKLGAADNTIKWSSATANTGSAGVNVGTNAAGPKASINSNGTFRSEPFTRAGTQYVREETVGGQIRYKNAATGKIVKTSEALGTNVPATTAKPGTNLPATTPKSGSNLPATTSQSGQAVANTTKALPAGNTPKALPPHNGGTTPPNPPKPNPNPNPAPTPSAPKVNVGGVAIGALGMVTGAVGLYESVEAKDTKATWADVGTGAMSGMTFAAGTAAVVNAIPVGGQIAYGVAVAVGTVVGAAGAGAKMFSETDCEIDPVTGQYACCNVSKLTNIQARLVNIGDEMFGDFPYVRTCMQGKNKFESNWIKARFLDDHWSKTGEVKFCSGWQMPEDGDWHIQAYGSSEEEGKVCWQWECVDAGMVRSGGKCIVATNVVQEQPEVVEPEIRVGDACPSDKLPQYATAGKYIKDGKGGFVCAATECKSGTYLVKNDKGVSQGWCRAGVAPVAGVATDASPQVSPSVGSTPENATSPQPIVQQSPCELGTSGWILFEGACITNEQQQQVLQEREKLRMRALTSQINNAVSQLESIESRFDVSVWKNKEGKFNTARLASDSIAGVVLGTAGGLITSTVVKKNQIENGFEDIKCVIGGQSVANWGDEFMVGIQ